MRISDWSSDVCSSDLAGWKLFADTVEAKSGKRPIKAVIFSHSHSDHFGGVGGVVTPEQVEAEKIRIIAPHGFSEEATSENVLAGGAMGRRAQIGRAPGRERGCTYV